MYLPSPPALSLLLACFETDGINDGKEVEFAAPGLVVPSAPAPHPSSPAFLHSEANQQEQGHGQGHGQEWEQGG